MYALSAAKTFALDLLFPVQCCGCGKEGTYFCPPCKAAIPMFPPACFVCKKLVPAGTHTPAGRTCRPCRKKSRIYGFFSPFSYDYQPIRSLIHDLKYQRMRGAAPILGELLLVSCVFHRIAFPKNALIIPIPLSKSRERTRGFNQSRLIADALANGLGLTIRAELLRKIKKTRPQIELLREERLKNMAGVFAVSDTAAVYKKTIILLDDVKTTGATLEEATRVLRSAGAKRVWAITVAR